MTHIRRPFLLLIALLMSLSVSTLTITACERVPVKAVEGGVHVDTANCTENQASMTDPQRAFLDCISGGDVRIRIELSRNAWDAIRVDAGVLDADAAFNEPSLPEAGIAGAYATRIVFIDGAHCRESRFDNGTTENARLDCQNGPYPFIVLLGRQEWRAIKARTKPAPFEAGPGK